MIFWESDYELIITSLKNYKKMFGERTMSFHDIGHIIEYFKEKLKNVSNR